MANGMQRGPVVHTLHTECLYCAEGVTTGSESTSPKRLQSRRERKRASRAQRRAAREAAEEKQMLADQQARWAIVVKLAGDPKALSGRYVMQTASMSTSSQALSSMLAPSFCPSQVRRNVVGRGR